MSNSESSIDVTLLPKIREKVEDLKKTLKEIGEDCKRRGKRTKYKDQWVISGFRFDAVAYALEKNSIIRRKVQEILKHLFKIFPYIPSEKIELNFDREEYEVVRVGDNNRVCCYFDHPPERSIFRNLFDFCEKLDDLETLLELQKPLYVALAYIFSYRQDNFSKSDFPELKPAVLDCAIDLALKNGWIAEAEQKGVYKINEKPEFKIKCPFCKKIISAYAEYCAHCGLYLLNMITREQKNTEEDIPHDFYIKNEKENKWIAYFKFESSKETEIWGDFSLKSMELYPFLKENAIEIPDYTLFAELYAEQIDHLTKFVSLDLYLHRTRWFKVSGRTIEETQQKMMRIIDSLKSCAEQLYQSYKVIIDAGEKYTKKDNFVKDVLMMWKDCFGPKLDEHPIFRAKETFTKVLICPNCGSEMPFYAKYCGHCGYELLSVKRFG